MTRFVRLPQRLTPAGQRMYRLTLNRPFTLPLAVAAVIVGVLALWHGAAVSAALSRITPETVAPGNTVVRFWGLIQLLGGLQVLRGVLTPRISVERNGWSFLIGSCIFYSAGLMGGLGLAGAAAGTYMAALAAGAGLRVLGLKMLTDTAKEAGRLRNGE